MRCFRGVELDAHELPREVLKLDLTDSGRDLSIASENQVSDGSKCRRVCLRIPLRDEPNGASLCSFDRVLESGEETRSEAKGCGLCPVALAGFQLGHGLDRLEQCRGPGCPESRAAGRDRAGDRGGDRRW